jgi:hypothetical protein
MKEHEAHGGSGQSALTVDIKSVTNGSGICGRSECPQQRTGGWRTIPPTTPAVNAAAIDSCDSFEQEALNGVMTF